MAGYIQRQLGSLHELSILLNRNKRRVPDIVDEESMTEQQFVRSFGTKVKSVRWSKRKDMVGLVVLGLHVGIWITRGTDNLRRVRAVNVVDGKMQITKRFLLLSDRDSLSNLQKGLLNWVQ